MYADAQIRFFPFLVRKEQRVKTDLSIAIIHNLLISLNITTHGIMVSNTPQVYNALPTIN